MQVQLAARRGRLSWEAASRKREQSFKEDLNSIRLIIQSIRKLSCMEICLELLDAIFVSELNSCTVC